MYLGTFNAFEFTAAADTPIDSLVANQTIVGITKSFTADGETGLAYIGSPAVVFEFPLDATGTAKTVGTTAYLNGDDEVVWAGGSGITEIGKVWKAVAATDTVAQIALYPVCADKAERVAAAVTPTADTITNNSGGTAATTIAAIGATYVQADVADAIATLAAQIAKLKADNAALIAALQAAGLMANS